MAARVASPLLWQPPRALLSLPQCWKVKLKAELKVRQGQKEVPSRNPDKKGFVSVFSPPEKLKIATQHTKNRVHSKR